MKRVICILVSIALSISICYANIINVPDDHETIQAGIDAAEAGDTVLVQPGVYDENIVIRTSGVTLASLLLTTGEEAYIDSTIIAGDGNGGWLVEIWVRDGGNDPVSLRGLTLNSNHQAGGLNCQVGRIFADDMVVSNNSQQGWGCGMMVEAHESGGAWVTMRRSRIIGNQGMSVGAVSVFSANLEMEDCIVSENVTTSDQHGQVAGIYTGPSMWGQAPEVTIRRTIISNNSSACDFGGANFLTGNVTLDQVTVTGNSIGANFSHGGVVFGGEGGVGGIGSIVNCIISGNEGIELSVNYSTISLSFSDVEGGPNRVEVSGNPRITWGDGMIDSDPLFVDPDNGDYRLTENSPCIDAGDPDSPRDPDGTRADMGAFYFSHNAPPEALNRIDDFTVVEDCGRVEIADLDTVFADPNGDTLTYSVFGLDELGLVVNDAHVLSLEPALNFNGDSLLVVVSASDACDSAVVRFLVTVMPVNDPPGQFNLISPNRQELDWFYEGDTIRFEWTASVDPDNETVRYLLRLDYHYGLGVDSVSFDADTLTFCYLSDTLRLAPWPPDGQQIDIIQRVTWWVVAISGADSVRSDSTFTFGLGPGDAKDRGNNGPSSFNLQYLFPNPFNSTTTIRFSIPSSSSTSLSVYGLDGRLMDIMNLGRLEAGEHRFVWNAEGLPGGMYLIRLESGGNVQTTKAILLR